MNASLNHLLSIFSLRALADGKSLLLADLLLLGILVMEPNSLIESNWLFILVLDVIFHPSVLVTVISHLVPALVFLCSGGLSVDTFSEAIKSGFELFPRNLAITIGVELFHEHLHLVLEGWETVNIEK